MARHVPTETQRSTVIVMAGLGATTAIIASKIGISEPVLRKAYSSELRDGVELVQLEARKNLLAAARADGAGRVTALVRLLEMIEGDKGATKRKVPAEPRIIVFNPGMMLERFPKRLNRRGIPLRARI